MLNPDVTQIVIGVDDVADCNCLAILRDGNRITKHIAVCFPSDVFANLIQSVFVSFVIAIQGVNSYVSWSISIMIIPWQSKDVIVPLSSNISRMPKLISGRISVDGLAELFLVDFAIFISLTDFDISLSVGVTLTTRGTNYQTPCIGRESHRPS